MSHTPQDQEEYSPITGIAPHPMCHQQAPQPFTELPRAKRTEEQILLVERIPPAEYAPLYACMHRVTLPSGTTGYCNTTTEDTCIGCGRPTCSTHWSSKDLLINDREGRGIYQLCQPCARLPHEDIEALRALRLRLNDTWS